MALAATIRLLESIEHKKEYLSECCRVCMRQRSDMKCVFSTEGCRTLQELEFCTGILITRQDVLPTKLCDSCLSTLSVAHKFKSDCLQSDAIFRKILAQRNKCSIKQEVKEEVVNVSRSSEYEVPVTKQEVKIQYSDDDGSQYSGDDDSQYSDDDSQYSGDDGLCVSAFESRLKSQDLQTKNKKAEKVITKEKNSTARAKNTTNLRYKYLRKITIKPEDLNEKDSTNGKLLKSKIPKKIIKPENLAEKKIGTRNTSKYFRKIIIEPEDLNEKTQVAKSSSSNANPMKKRILKPLKKKKGRKHRKLYCGDCDTHFEDHDIIVKHRKDVHGSELVCEICGKVFVLYSSLYNHLKTHQQRSYKCTVCDYSTNDMSNLKKHTQIHDDNQYVCEYCSKSFQTHRGVRAHVQRYHEVVTGKQLPCPRCGKAFYTKYKLNRHLDSHDNIKRYKCDYCHSQYTRRSHLRMHLEKAHNTTLPKFIGGRLIATVNGPSESNVEK